MEEIDVFKSLRESVDGELAPIVDEREAARLKLIADHKAWLKKQRKSIQVHINFSRWEFTSGISIRLNMKTTWIITKCNLSI